MRSPQTSGSEKTQTSQTCRRSVRMAASPGCSRSGNSVASAARVPSPCSFPSRRATCSSAISATRSPADEHPAPERSPFQTPRFVRAARVLLQRPLASAQCLTPALGISQDFFNHPYPLSCRTVHGSRGRLNLADMCQMMRLETCAASAAQRDACSSCSVSSLKADASEIVSVTRGASGGSRIK